MRDHRVSFGRSVRGETKNGGGGAASSCWWHWRRAAGGGIGVSILRKAGGRRCRRGGAARASLLPTTVSSSPFSVFGKNRLQPRTDDLCVRDRDFGRHALLLALSELFVLG